MLYISLILAACLLVAVNWIVTRCKNAGSMVAVCMVMLVGPPLVNLYLPAVLLLSLCLPFVWVGWDLSGRGPAVFRSLSLVAALAAFGITGVMAYQAEQSEARLRVRYPYRSLEARLPVPQASSRVNPLTPEAEARLVLLEDTVRTGDLRTWRLERLHNVSVAAFVDRFGFGYARVAPGPTEANLAVEQPEDSTPFQPGTPLPFVSSPGEWKDPSPDDEASLGGLLEESVTQFVFPRGFGDFKDRRHVAGFEPHRFSKTPDLPRRWELRSLELVGLLLEDEPRVYLSKQLPMMTEHRRDVRTRPLDRFEGLGLSRLQAGEDLMIARSGDTVRMVGAIRSLKQCVACHGCERGDLLGAFTYTIAAAPIP